VPNVVEIPPVLEYTASEDPFAIGHPCEVAYEDYPDILVVPKWPGYFPLTCKWSPAARSRAAGTVMQGRLFVTGGLQGKDHTFDVVPMNDVWYRDVTAPSTWIVQRPDDQSDQRRFSFSCNNEGHEMIGPSCIYEYRLMHASDTLLQNDMTRGKGVPNGDAPFDVVRDWTLSSGAFDYSEWLQGGSYVLQVRAIDAAGNKDPNLIYGKNEYAWKFEPPPPIILIICLCLVFVALCIFVFLYWRRKRRKAAMERYALKRMRRKFKAAKGKEALGGRGKKGKKKRNKQKEKGGKKKVSKATQERRLKERREKMRRERAAKTR
jgi:hypothetical protein